MSNTYCVVLSFFGQLCCQFFWVIHFWKPLRYSPTFIMKIAMTKYVIKFVSDLPQVSGFLWALIYQVSSTNKTDCHDFKKEWVHIEALPKTTFSSSTQLSIYFFPWQSNVSLPRLSLSSIMPNGLFDIGEQVPVMKFLTLDVKQQIIDQLLHNWL